MIIAVKLNYLMRLLTELLNVMTGEMLTVNYTTDSVIYYSNKQKPSLRWTGEDFSSNTKLISR